MPEGPECHIIGWKLGEYCKEHRVIGVTVRKGRYAKPAELARSGISEFNAVLKAKPATVLSTGAKGKLVYAVFDNGWAMLSTMGLTGSWTDRRTANCDVSLDMQNDHHEDVIRPLWFKDQLHYGTIKFVQKAELDKKLTQLGPDVVVADGCTPEWWCALCKRKGEWTLPKLLLEQSLIAGVGNYLKAEALYQAHASPIAKIQEFTEGELLEVFRAVLDVTARCYAWKAYKVNGHRNRIPGHEAAAPRFLLKVYNKGSDPQGNAVIKTKTTDGRVTHWVPAVQTHPGSYAV
jgi:formamidopyrimidine-DNA glycosylase